MRSFILAAFATLAFATFCSAVPPPRGPRPTPTQPPTAPAPSKPPTHCPPPTGVARRDTTPPTNGPASLDSVFTSFTNAVGPISDNMAQLKKGSVGADAFAQSLLDTKQHISDAADQLNKLSAASIEAIMENSATGAPLDRDTYIQLASNTLTVLIIPVVQAITYVPMTDIVSFGFEILGVIQPFLVIVFPSIFDLIGVSGVLVIIRNVAIAFLQITFL